MKSRMTLWAAAGVVVMVNALALLHAVRNRAGGPVQTVTLSERELSWYNTSEDSGVTLRLNWLHAHDQKPWIGEDSIRALGFNLDSDRNEANPWRAFRRQGRRRAYVAFELRRDGPREGSQLAPMDASREAASLLSKYRGRHDLVILPVSVMPYLREERTEDGRGGTGRRVVDLQFMDVPSEIHVPLPLAEQVRAMKPGRECEITLQYGRFFEPWVSAVRFR
ncbi:MAG: DUF4824 family protein [Acidobacteria bacterium]|nr:DUF4824 family protein [Acidobacteriota bacterium]